MAQQLQGGVSSAVQRFLSPTPRSPPSSLPLGPASPAPPSPPPCLLPCVTLAHPRKNFMASSDRELDEVLRCANLPERPPAQPASRARAGAGAAHDAQAPGQVKRRAVDEVGEGGRPFPCLLACLLA